MIISEKLTPAQILFLQETVAAASALGSADRLVVLSRLDAAGPVSSSAMARGCGIGQCGARLLLSDLSGLGIVEAGEDGSYRSVVANLSRGRPDYYLHGLNLMRCFAMADQSSMPVMLKVPINSTLT